MERAHVTPADLVRRTDGAISFARITNWKSGLNDPKNSILPFLSEVTGASIGELLGDDSLPPPKPSQKRKAEGRIVSVGGTPLSPIKVVGMASAGPGTYVVDPSEELVYVPQKLADLGGLGWIVDGESMMPALEPGDIALFREYRQPRRGYTFLVKSSDGEFRVKNLDWLDDQWCLVSLNKNFEPEHLEDHEILGYLIGWYRSRGSRETLDSDPNGLLLA